MRASAKLSARPVAAPTTPEPARWWQWILLYPALGISLLTAAPQWFDKAQSAWAGTKVPLEDAEKQSKLWRRNLTCAAAPFNWHNNPSNVKVDATICDSGDIFVRAATPANGQFFKWVPIEEIVQSPPVGGNPLIPTAQASTGTPGWRTLELTREARSTPALPLIRVQQQGNVICQRFIDQRMLLRHVQTPQGCFDEVVDTYNGAVVRRTQVPCRQGC